MSTPLITLRGYAAATVAIAVATAIGMTLGQRASLLADEAMLYALAIFVAALWGRGPGLYAAALSIVVFDFCFVEPRFTFSIADPAFLITFSVMFCCGVAIGGLVARLRSAEMAALERERRISAEKTRNALLSAVSHDLRTPLAVITGTATALRETAPPEQHAAVDAIVDESVRLGRIVENLLAVTKVEAGANPRREWVPIEELVGAALGRVDVALAGRAVTVDVDAHVLGHLDPILGELLLVNLLDNASKHTPVETPIELSAWRDGCCVVLEVADRGPGLPAGAENLVFERFFQASQNRRGVGLGLAVCRGISVAHGGSIEAVRRDGGGALFRVRVPDGAALPRFDRPPMLQEAVGRA